jgi:hypothetical protein
MEPLSYKKKEIPKSTQGDSLEALVAKHKAKALEKDSEKILKA